MGGTIIVCCDGTWNDPDDQTNVHRTYRLLRSCLQKVSDKRLGDDRRVCRGAAPDGRRVRVYYDTGVGARRWDKGRGGLFGSGLGENVRQAYAFLAKRAEPADELFLFGFSRGAFTIRSLCGLLGCAGLPATPSAEALDAAWRFYRLPPVRRPGSAEEAALKAFGFRPVQVRFLGVYDTVGSLGVPVPRLRWLNGLLERALGGVIRFHDTSLGRNVETACQALAIHERRGLFKPVVWSRAPGRVTRPDGAIVEQRVLQVWFSGAHADVGGGYPHGDLSDLAFEWMMRRAMESGLPVDAKNLAAAVNGNCYGFRHDSDRGWLGRAINGDLVQTVRTLTTALPMGLGLLVRLLDLGGSLLTVRSMERGIGGEIETDDGTFCVPVGERVHASVLERYRGEHLPANVRTALAAGVPIFHERREPRHPGATGETVRLDGVPCPLKDKSPTGVRVGNAAWLKPGAEVELEREGQGAALATVAWRHGDEAGLSVAGAAPAAVPRSNGARRTRPPRDRRSRSTAPMLTSPASAPA